MAKSGKKHEIRKVMGTRARKDALERSLKLLCILDFVETYLKPHLDISNRFGQLD